MLCFHKNIKLNILTTKMKNLLKPFADASRCCFSLQNESAADNLRRRGGDNFVERFH